MRNDSEHRIKQMNEALWLRQEMLVYTLVGKNGLLPFSPKRYSKIPLFWNYLVKYPCFETRFYIETRFSKNRVSK